MQATIGYKPELSTTPDDDEIQWCVECGDYAGTIDGNHELCLECSGLV